MTKIINWKTKETIIEDDDLSTRGLIEKVIRNRFFLGYADLRDALLHEGYFIDANFAFADLRDANFKKSSLADSSFNGANLFGANLREAYLRSADLRGANLQYADLRSANFKDANLRGANLCNAAFGKYKEFRNPLSFDGASLLGAKINEDQKDDLLEALGVEII